MICIITKDTPGMYYVVMFNIAAARRNYLVDER